MSTGYETAHISVGEPTWVDVCPRCFGSMYELPLTGITASGVRPMGAVTVCEECDTAKEVVARYLASLRGGSSSDR